MTWRSEMTLQVGGVYQSVQCAYAVQASTFVMFPDVHSACRAASILRDETAVDAVELFDTASLRLASLLAACQLMDIVMRDVHICTINLYVCLLHLSLDLRSARASLVRC